MYKKILITTDLSELSKQKTSAILTAVSGVGTEIYLIHVIEPIPSYTSSLSPFTDVGTMGIESATEAMAKLGEFFKVPEDKQQVKVGSIKRTILEFAEREDIDLIIVSSHSRHGLAKLLGSTANAIANRADCDVLILRSHPMDD